MFFKIGVLKKFAIFTAKHLCWSLFLIKACDKTSEKTRTQIIDGKQVVFQKKKTFANLLLTFKSKFFKDNHLWMCY